MGNAACKADFMAEQVISPLTIQPHFCDSFTESHFETMKIQVTTTCAHIVACINYMGLIGHTAVTLLGNVPSWNPLNYLFESFGLTLFAPGKFFSEESFSYMFWLLITG